MRKRTIVLFVLLFGTLWIVLPLLLTQYARSLLNKDPCYIESEPNRSTAPTDKYFRAHKLLAVISHVPFTGLDATDLAGASASRCVGNYLLAANQLKIAVREKFVPR